VNFKDKIRNSFNTLHRH